jgi:hypothetical protein
MNLFMTLCLSKEEREPETDPAWVAEVSEDLRVREEPEVDIIVVVVAMES